MGLRKDGRHVVSVTLLPHHFEVLTKLCKDTDRPVSVFVRELILQKLREEGLLNG